MTDVIDKKAARLMSLFFGFIGGVFLILGLLMLWDIDKNTDTNTMYRLICFFLGSIGCFNASHFVENLRRD